MAKKKITKKTVKKERESIIDGDFSTASDTDNPNRVFVSIAKTVNIGNYESLRVEIGQGQGVPNGMTFDKVRKGVTNIVTDALIETLKMIKDELS